MLGKQKCKILREIRRQIAQENDIPYVTRDCPHQGDCSGTCPRCESELRYLERQLEARAALGKRVAVAAICAGMSLGAAGCSPKSLLPSQETDLSGAVPPYEESTSSPEVYVTTGEVAWPEDGDVETGELDESQFCPGAGDDVVQPGGAGLELSGAVAYDS